MEAQREAGLPPLYGRDTATPWPIRPPHVGRPPLSDLIVIPVVEGRHDRSATVITPCVNWMPIPLA